MIINNQGHSEYAPEKSPIDNEFGLHKYKLLGETEPTTALEETSTLNWNVPLPEGKTMRESVLIEQLNQFFSLYEEAKYSEPVLFNPNDALSGEEYLNSLNYLDKESFDSAIREFSHHLVVEVINGLRIAKLKAREPDKIIVYAPDNSSDVYVSLQVLRDLKRRYGQKFPFEKYITFISEQDPTHHNLILALDPLKKDTKVKLVMFDDFSISGEQMSDKVGKIHSYYKNKIPKKIRFDINVMAGPPGRFIDLGGSNRVPVKSVYKLKQNTRASPISTGSHSVTDYEVSTRLNEIKDDLIGWLRLVNPQELSKLASKYPLILNLDGTLKPLAIVKIRKPYKSYEHKQESRYMDLTRPEIREMVNEVKGFFSTQTYSLLIPQK